MKKFCVILLGGLLLASCGEKARERTWLTEDDVNIAIDETMQPAFDMQINYFALENPMAAMHPIYCPEDSAMRLLVRDSVRSCVGTRLLSDNELEIIKSHKLAAYWERIAYDAFALIVNKNNADTLISLDEVKGIANGTITRWEQLAKGQKKGEIKLLFDDSRSSTVRYMRDSLCGGNDLQGNVFAQGSAKDVIDMVKSDANVIGVVGVDWLRPEGVGALTSFQGLDVNVMMVRRDSLHYHRRPFQYYIGTGEYPLVRDVYAFTTDFRRNSKEWAFYMWLKGQKGQTIFNKYTQMLTVMPVQVRDVAIK